MPHLTNKLFWFCNRKLHSFLKEETFQLLSDIKIFLNGLLHSWNKNKQVSHHESVCLQTLLWMHGVTMWIISQTGLV